MDLVDWRGWGGVRCLGLPQEVREGWFVAFVLERFGRGLLPAIFYLQWRSATPSLTVSGLTLGGNANQEKGVGNYGQIICVQNDQNLKTALITFSSWKCVAFSIAPINHPLVSSIKSKELDS